MAIVKDTNKIPVTTQSVNTGIVGDNSPNPANQSSQEATTAQKDMEKSVEESIGEKTQANEPVVPASDTQKDLTLGDPSKGDLADTNNLLNPEIQMEADKKYNQLLEEEFRKKMVEDEVARKMLAHRQGAGAVDTDNPYNLKSGEKVTYIVNGIAVDANGQAVLQS